jgi:hypothetical protein
MPKKTKKEKALAQARRLIQNARLHSSIEIPQTAHRTVSDVQIPSSFQYQAKSAPVISAKTEVIDQQEFVSIRKDILKTVILASVAIAFEFIVYLKLG